MKFVLHVLAAVCLMAAGWGLARWMAKPVITIEEVVVTETKYIRAAETEQELKNCYESPIVITAEMVDTYMHITAADNCKQASAQVMMDCEPRPRDGSELMLSHVLAAVGGALLVLIAL